MTDFILLQAAYDKALAGHLVTRDALEVARSNLYRAKARAFVSDLKSRGITKGCKVRVTGKDCDTLAYYAGTPADGFMNPRPILKVVLGNGKRGKAELYWIPKDYRLDLAGQRQGE